MYYERYYTNHLATKQQEMQAFIQANTKVGETASRRESDTPVDDGTMSQRDAITQLRSEIRQKVRQSAQTVKKSRHFVPVLAGTLVLITVLAIQFNRPIVGAIVAYTSPGTIEPQNIIVDPTVNVQVGPEPRMIIPKINVDAPVVYGVGADHTSQMKAMESGIAHFAIAGANAVPGQVGNAVFAAHSSNDAFARGDYKFVFAQNEKLTKDDVIYMNYNGTRYTYKVTSTEVVLPSEVSKVQLNTDKPMLTLISCVPLGTAEKRLLVFAEQISPDPSGATEQSVSTEPAASSTTIPGKPSPTLFERLFGAQ
jgi:sortase A